ncbi:unnamed protein product [Lampetra fluviatilis]
MLLCALVSVCSVIIISVALFCNDAEKSDAEKSDAEKSDAARATWAREAADDSDHNCARRGACHGLETLDQTPRVGGGSCCCRCRCGPCQRRLGLARPHSAVARRTQPAAAHLVPLRASKGELSREEEVEVEPP